MRTAASKGDAKVVEMLVKAKANINERDGKVNTSAAFPLYFPYIYIYIECVAVFVVVLCFARARHLFVSLVLALVKHHIDTMLRRVKRFCGSPHGMVVQRS